MYYFTIYLVVVNLITFFLYGIDKSKAKHRKWRIKESVLLGFGFFGGAIGALLGMVVFRHKTKHWYFWIVNFLGLCVIFAVDWLIRLL
ncbi:MAG: DUF1294 domain-containing protein [Ruminococcaceae bacterium]|nr:DUF1294 domain-containing protein [Oscillospiraceae bacterium]